MINKFLSSHRNDIKNEKEKITRLMRLYENYYNLSKSFKTILEWIKFELLKPLKEKRTGILNKSLVFQSKSGYGKSTFLKRIIDPVFKAGALFLDSKHQTPQSLVNTHVFYSPDDAKINSLYNYTLVPMGEFLLNIKYSDKIFT